MATHIIKPNCEKCGKPAVTDFHFNATTNGVKSKFTQLKCGHVTKEECITIQPFDDIVSFSGNRLLPFQKKVCEIAAKENFRVLLNLEMGLGKTVVSFALMRKYLKELSPVAIVCKSGLVTQMAMEWLDWVETPVQVIQSSKDKPDWRYFKAFIISRDLLRNLKWLPDFKVKTLIIDEVQGIKNPDAARTKCVQDLGKSATYILGLSGTPIKSNAGEYFNILNLLDPKHFSVRAEFYDNYVDYYFDDNGKLHTGGIKRESYNHFKEVTSRYIIRRTREEVMPELPKIWRKFHFCNLSKEVKKAYMSELNTFLDAYNNSMGAEGQEAFAAANAINASLMRMRQLVGIAKIDPTVEFAEDFLEEHKDNPAKKLVIFIHHIDVGTILIQKLNKLCEQMGFDPVLRVEGGMKSEASWNIEQEFKNNPKRRLLVASTLAAGEGKNYQFCSDAIMMERQWTPPDEEQAEARFTRIGSIADKVGVTYVVAYGTVDEIFAKIIERKRSVLTQVHEGVWTDAMQSDIMKQLTETLVKEGLTMFRL